MAVAFAPLLSVPFKDYLKHMERDHSEWGQKGHHISVDKIICGLLQQRLVTDGWKVCQRSRTHVYLVT